MPRFTARPITLTTRYFAACLTGDAPTFGKVHWRLRTKLFNQATRNATTDATR